MKRWVVLFALLPVFLGLNGQQVKKNIPPFRIQLQDGKYFHASELDKSRPLLLVYFDPDCDHCLLFVNDLLKNINLFTKVQIVMITYVPLSSTRKFITQAGLNQYPGIKAGTEGTTFVVRYHYDVVQFPFLALHDQTGNLFATFESEVPTARELAVMFSK
jgi:peroxiredoxin